MSARATAGLMFSLAGFIFILGVMFAEISYPGYNVSTNYISDLGVWSKPLALLFNTAMVVLGTLMVVGGLMAHREFRRPLNTVLFALNGVGVVGVGLFPETTGHHVLFALIAFLFGGLAAIAAYHLTGPVLSYLCVILGAISIAALVLTGLKADLGLGPGGMERMIAYPEAVWALLFGGYLLAPSAISHVPPSERRA